MCQAGMKFIIKWQNIHRRELQQFVHAQKFPAQGKHNNNDFLDQNIQSLTPYLI